MIDVALAACDAYLDLCPDDRLLRDALADRGLSTQVVTWSHEAYDWTQVRCCLPRNTWDYGQALRDFDHWLGRAHELTRLWNPVRTLRLAVSRDALLTTLARSGVPTIDGATFAAGRTVDLGRELASRGWEEAVVEPASVRADREAQRVSSGAIQRGQKALEHVLATGDALLSPLAPQARERGILSVVYLDGGYSHSVRRHPHEGEWQIAHDFDGRIEAALPREEDLRVARAALTAVEEVTRDELLYARVDLLRDAQERPRVHELALIEPALYFAWGEDSADRLAGAVFARLARG